MRNLVTSLMLTTIMAMAASGSAVARDGVIDNGNALYEGYREYQALMEGRDHNPYDAASFSGLVVGQADLLRILGHICLSDSVARIQIADVVGNYLIDNPEKRNERSTVLIATALIEAFPCADGD